MRRWIIIAGVGVLLLLVGYAFGRYAQPAKVVTRTVETVKTVTQIQFKDRVVVETTVRYVRAKQTHQVVVEVKKPDGEVVKTTTTDTATSTKADEGKTSEKSTQATQVATAESSKETTKEIDYKRPDWHLGAFVGLQLHQGPAYGVSASRRLLGPFWGTLSIDTGERVNLGASLEF